MSRRDKTTAREVHRHLISRRRFIAFLISVPAGLLAAYTFWRFQSPKTIGGPPVIYYGKDTCERCGMVISDPRFACAYYSANIGDWRKFDDIGCMFVLLKKDKYERKTAYVHDFETTRWIEGEEATFVISGAIKTPMGTGIVAFSLAADAQFFVKENGGETYSFSKLAQE